MNTTIKTRLTLYTHNMTYMTPLGSAFGKFHRSSSALIIYYLFCYTVDNNDSIGKTYSQSDDNSM
jgi:hypothetical protein